MPCHRRLLALSVSTSSAVALLGGEIVSAQVQQPASAGDRVLGLDVSAWQGNIAQTTWNNIRNVENRQFVFIRSSRGGTTGYYNQSDPNNVNGDNTLSQRYDDPYFVQNINRSTAAGMLAGPYHFGRMDIIESTTNSGGIANTGTDEASHFLEMAGSWMRPGYLLPVFDLEAGASQRSTASMSQFAREFSDRIYQVKGVRPIVYLSSSYATNEVDSTVPAYFPNLWIARWPNQADPNAIDVQNIDPPAASGYPNVYGKWNPTYPNTPNPHPWQVWQYASTGRLQSFNSGNSNLDFNVAHGNIEYMRDMQVPALWTGAGTGSWSTLSNWNSGQPAVAPVYGEGQVSPVGAQTLPAARLPGAGDNVDLDRPNANVTVTLAAAANVRRLDLNERLNVVAGGSINTRLSGQVGAGGTLALGSGGSATFTEGYVNSGGVLEIGGNGTLNVGALFVGPDGVVRFNGGDGTAAGTGLIQGKAGVANPTLNLLGGTRTFDVGDGAAATDLRVALPLTNGNFTKMGAGTIELTGDNSAYAGTLLVGAGNLRLSSANQIGTAGVRAASSGAVRVEGDGLDFTRTMTLSGRGFLGNGGLVNVAGDNTWSGDVVLSGTQHNQNDAGLNQISALAGTTLTMSGVVKGSVSPIATLFSWGKLGAGDVVLTGASPNTYTNLTRVFDGRLIIEKDGALGAAGQIDAGGSTIQLPGASSAIAFRAPAGSPGLTYATQEWIFTEGNGVNGAQLDNLGGANAFAGHVGVGGPVVNDRQQAYLGVTAGSLEIQGGIHARGTAGSSVAEARDIFKRGSGTLTLSGMNAGGPSNAFARQLADGSTFTVEAGMVRLKGTAGNGENVGGVDAWHVNGGAALALAQGGAAGNANIAFHGGTLRPEQAMLAANALTFAGDGTIDTGAPAASFTATFAGDVTGNGTLTKTGFGGSVYFAGAVHAFGGAINVVGDTLGIAPGGTDASVANVNGIAIASNARFDLTDNALVVRTTPAAAVEQLVATGYDGGDWDGAGGIVSTTAAGNDWIYTLGVADNARLGLAAFGGHAGLSGAETFVSYTIVGDADLSGTVNAADFARFRAGFMNEMPDAWLFGDFNYSGVVDGADFELYLLGFLNQPGSHLTDSFAGDLTTFAVENGFDPTLVPEPGSLALLAAGAGLMLRRRRR